MIEDVFNDPEIAAETAQLEDAVDGSPLRGYSDSLEDIAKKARSSWSKEDSLVVAASVALLLAIGTRFLSDWTETPEIKMSNEEAEKIAKPATRIVLRHVKIDPAKKGDIADAMALIAAVGDYALRVHMAMDEKKRIAMENMEQWQSQQQSQN